MTDDPGLANQQTGVKPGRVAESPQPHLCHVGLLCRSHLTIPKMSAEEEKKEEPTKVAAAAEVRAPHSPKNDSARSVSTQPWAGIIKYRFALLS